MPGVPAAEFPENVVSETSKVALNQLKMAPPEPASGAPDAPVEVAELSEIVHPLIVRRPSLPSKMAPPLRIAELPEITQFVSVVGCEPPITKAPPSVWLAFPEKVLSVTVNVLLSTLIPAPPRPAC